MSTRQKSVGPPRGDGPTGRSPMPTIAGGRHSSPTSPTTPTPGATARYARAKATPASSIRSGGSGGPSRFWAPSTRRSSSSPAPAAPTAARVSLAARCGRAGSSTIHGPTDIPSVARMGGTAPSRLSSRVRRSAPTTTVRRRHLIFAATSRSFPRHAVVAARIAGAASWGDLVVRRQFSASGSGPQLLGFDFGSDAIGLLRGLSEDAIVGTRAAVVNVDYRFPLLQIERGVGTWPAFARVLHGAVFVDAGHAWDSMFERSDVTVSLGGRTLARRVSSGTCCP